MPREIAELRFEALGTTCSLFAVGAGGGTLERARDWVLERHRRFTRFEDASELSRLNRGAGGWGEVSDELADLLRDSLHAYEVSGGLVHVGVIGCVIGAGYGRPFVEGPTTPRPTIPPPPLPEMLSLRPGQAYLAPGTGVDLGGIAKGWMADRLCAAMGGNLLANLGGDLFAAGTGPDGEGWPIDLAGTTVLLQDQGAATSSVRKRAWGAGLHHLIDPRTGRPAASDLAQVSVVAANAAEAEVSAKTALLLGSGQAREFLAARGLAWWMEAA